MFISYLHVYLPLTPPYMRFRIRRFLIPHLMRLTTFVFGFFQAFHMHMRMRHLSHSSVSRQSRFMFSVLRINSNKCSLSNDTSTMLSSDIHMKVCTPPYHSDSVLSLWGQSLHKLMFSAFVPSYGNFQLLSLNY